MIFVPGLSLIVNVIVIIMGIIFSARTFFFVKLPRKINKIIGAFLFLVVFSVIVSGAAFSIVKGITGESNIKLVKHLIEERTATANALVIKEEDKTEFHCVLDTSLLTTTNSLSDFLDMQQQDNSFEARENLARQFNIKDYQGKAEQNLKLLTLLRKTAPVCANKN